jgi:hypothetical protein
MTNKEMLDQVEWIMDTIEQTEQGKKMSEKDKYMVAIKIQELTLKEEYNRLYAAANVVIGDKTPSALEKIAMELESIAENILENSKSTY